MKTFNYKYVSIITILLLFLFSPRVLPGDINVKISESAFNNLMETMTTAKYLSYGHVGDQGLGITYYSVKVKSIVLDVLPGNMFSLSIVADGQANVNLGIWKPELEEPNRSITITGTLDLQPKGIGYKVVFNPCSISVGGSGWFHDNVESVANGMLSSLPEISTSSNSSLLPAVASQFFTSGTPTLSTTDSEIILGLTLAAGPRYITAYNDVNQQMNVGSVQDEEGTDNYVSYPSPKTFEWTTGTTQKLQTPEQLLPNNTDGKNKYKNWISNVSGSQIDIGTRRIGITVGSQDETYKAKFDQAQRVQLSNILLESNTSNGTVMYRYSPELVATGPTFDDYDYHYSNYSYPHPINTNVPNGTYGFDWVFTQWSDGSTSQSRSIVVDQDKNLQAKHKAHLGSTLVGVTANNNQHRIARLPNSTSTIAMVYASANRIWGTKDIYDQGEFENEKRMSLEATSSKTYKSPSIACDNYWRFYIVYQETEQSGSTYTHRLYNVETNCDLNPINSEPELITSWTSTSDDDAQPCIAYGKISSNGDQYKTLAVVYKRGNSFYINARRLNPEAVWYENMLSNTENASQASIALEMDENATMQYGHMTYAKDGHVHYARLHMANPYNVYMENYINLSEYYDQYLSNDSPSLVLKPVSGGGTDEVYVSWHAVPEAIIGGVHNVIVTRQKNSSGWRPYKQISHSNHQSSAPSIAYDASQNILSLYFQCSSHIGYTEATPGSGSWNWSAVQNAADNASNPNAIAYTDGRCALWTTGTAAPYRIVPQVTYTGEELVTGRGDGKKTNVLSKSSAGISVQYYRAATINLERLSISNPLLSDLKGRLILKVEPYTWEKTGQVIPFTEADTLLTNYLGTQPSTVIASAGRVLAKYSILWNDVQVPKSLSDMALFTSQAGTISSQRQFTFGDLLALGSTNTSTSLNLAYTVSSLAGKSIQMQVRSLDAVYGEIYHTSDGSEMPKQGQTYEEVIQQIPTTMALLDAYPNPFNPSTSIKYQLPVNSIVSLKVYDVIGREVAILADGVKETGYYNATFNASRLASGIYFARFTATPQDGSLPFSQTMKMLLSK